MGQGFPKTRPITGAKFIICNFLQLNFSFYPDLGKFKLYTGLEISDSTYKRKRGTHMYTHLYTCIYAFGGGQLTYF